MSEAETNGAVTKGVSKADLWKRVPTLSDQIETLQAQLERERSARQELEATVQAQDALLDAHGAKLNAVTTVLTGEHNAPLPDDIEAGVLDRLETIESQAGSPNTAVSSAGLSQDVREQLLPIHEMWIDLREGNEQRIPDVSQCRGARLFERFIRKASGKPSVGVDASYGTYTMSSDTAREVLEEAGDMTKTGQSMTVKRAFQAVQRLSKVEDCECDSIEECAHGLVRFEPGHPNTLVTEKDQFNRAMEHVEAAIEGSVDATPDDPSEDGGEGPAQTDETTAEALQDERARLQQATHPEDSTEGEDEG